MTARPPIVFVIGEKEIEQPSGPEPFLLAERPMDALQQRHKLAVLLIRRQ